MIPSSTVKYRSGAVFYEFHQDPDFFYLTGFLEPESVAVIGLSPTTKERRGELTPAKKRPGWRVNMYSTSLSAARMRMPSYGTVPGRESKGLRRRLMLIKWVHHDVLRRL